MRQRRRLEEIGVMFTDNNKSKDEQTAHPSKYPQGYFKDKPCKFCDTVFTPKAPSEMYCCDSCKENAKAEIYLKRFYNISLEEYIDMYIKQKGVCKICKTEGFRLDPNSKIKLVVDHCHNTGKVRGLLCHNCNRGLGLFKDSLEFLSNSQPCFVFTNPP